MEGLLLRNFFSAYVHYTPLDDYQSLGGSGAIILRISVTIEGHFYRVYGQLYGTHGGRRLDSPTRPFWNMSFTPAWMDLYNG